MAKSPHFSQNGLEKSDRLRPPETDQKSLLKRVHKRSMVFFGLPGGLFWQKVKMAVENQPTDVPLILTKNRKLLEIIYRLSMECIQVTIMDYS